MIDKITVPMALALATSKRLGFAVSVLLISLTTLSCSTATPIAPEPDLSRQRVGDSADSVSSSGASDSGLSRFIDSSGNLPVEVHIVGKARNVEFVEDAMGTVSELYQQCDVSLQTNIQRLEAIPTEAVDVEQRYQLTQQYALKKPSVFIIDSSTEGDVGFSYLPKLRRDVSGTAWITGRVSDACFAWIVAHEIGHIVLNDGAHHPRARNIMNARCSAGNNYNKTSAPPTWSKNQCEIMRSSAP